MASHLAPVDGLRVLATASLVAFHATLIASGLLPAQGEAWTAFCTHPLAGLLQGGAFSVDVFLLLSGFAPRAQVRGREARRQPEPRPGRRRRGGGDARVPAVARAAARRRHPGRDAKN